MNTLLRVVLPAVRASMLPSPAQAEKAIEGAEIPERHVDSELRRADA